MATKLDPSEPKPDIAKPPIRIPFARIGILIGLAALIVAGAIIICCQAPLKKKFTNSTGIEFVLIPAGSFTMGSSNGDNTEQPPHDVKIAQSFYLQTTEVTQGQWKKVMGYNLSGFYKCGDDCPEEGVSWEDAQRFIEKLNQLEKTKAYRLPSEAEWEYACRTRTTTEYSFGDDASKLGEYAWHSNNSKNTTHRVATRQPNSWGLYDMHGNVWEWVEDDWHVNYNEAPTDGRAWIDSPRGTYRVIRGGGWNYGARDCRSAARFSVRPGFLSGDVGFRLSRSVALGP
jgi:formylglycine-generating enzyme required for sulfatase activity